MGAPQYQTTDLDFTTASLFEQAVGFTPRIDRERGVIYDVKVCGLESPNCPTILPSKDNPHPVQPTKGTRYTIPAFKKAANLYENAPVYLNHVERDSRGRAAKTATRGVNDLFGSIRNVRVTESGPRADLHCDPNHPFYKSLLHDIDSGRYRFGLSHHARGGGPVKDGYLIVEDIPVVKSVDLVVDSATTANLFESTAMTTPATIKFRDLLERLLPRVPRGSKRLAFVEFMESDVMAEKDPAMLKEEDPLPMGDLPVEEPAADADPDAALLAAFEQACQPLVTAALGGDTEALKKLNDWIKTHMKLAGGGSAPAKSDPAPAAETSESRATDALTADERKALARYRGREAALIECKKYNFDPSEADLNGLAELSEATRGPMILSLVQRLRAPRSLPAGGAAKASPAAPEPGKPVPDAAYREALSRLGVANQ